MVLSLEALLIHARKVTLKWADFVLNPVNYKLRPYCELRKKLALSFKMYWQAQTNLKVFCLFG